MVKFVEVDPDEVPNLRESHRGRVSYPILKGFLETNKPLVMLDRTGMQNSMQSLTSSLGNYIRTHQLPIKLFQRRGQLYLMRLDLDDKGNPVEWDPNGQSAMTEEEAVLIDTDEVERRFQQEKDQTTK